MSLLTSFRASTRQVVRANLAVPASTFHSSAVRGLKEDDRDRDDLPHHYESHKQEGLKDRKEGSAKWKSELASNSEAEVKADRGELDNEAPFQEAMKEAKEYKQSKSQKGAH